MCPVECPKVQPAEADAKGCFLDCHSPKCEAVCRIINFYLCLIILLPNYVCIVTKQSEKQIATVPEQHALTPGSQVEMVLFFTSTARAGPAQGAGLSCLPSGPALGKSDEHFSLVSDPNLQINTCFIGLCPSGRTRDYTWIQALDNEVDHFQFSYDGNAQIIPEGHSSKWNSLYNDLTIERTSSKNSVIVIVPEIVEVLVSVVPVSEEENQIHNYRIPCDLESTDTDTRYGYDTIRYGYGDTAKSKKAGYGYG
ncbi:hypothetical protein HYC85_017818 [Camellia sinensis]|uniref:Uncharacterized protein n=1 Tax=Camellia sinensis TaxID=4442 RepID=A0A7J7GUV8_CAMSI|nr:hypothetical protein HYC85_017818 [Camellia sinensis]